ADGWLTTRPLEHRYPVMLSGIKSEMKCAADEPGQRSHCQPADRKREQPLVVLFVAVGGKRAPSHCYRQKIGVSAPLLPAPIARRFIGVPSWMDKQDTSAGEHCQPFCRAATVVNKLFCLPPAVGRREVRRLVVEFFAA